MIEGLRVKMIVMNAQLAIVVLALLFVAGCSSRVEYPPTANAASASSSMNINTATADELEKLPHIGRKTAEGIVQFREENGRFRRVEYLMQVRGISESRFAEIRHLLKTE